MVNLSLEANSVSKSYGKKEVVKGYTAHFYSGSVYGLLGPNGSGKTTCLHILSGILKATAGDVIINGVPVEDKMSRLSIGFAPDDLPLPTMLTGREYLEFHDRLRQRDDHDAADILSSEFGISQDLDRLIGEYSHGMKRKIQLIAATMHRPVILLLDEPYRGLDPDASYVLRFLLKQYTAEGGAVVVATHDMLRAEQDCDRVDIIVQGSVVASGTPNALIKNSPQTKTLEDVFLEAIGVLGDPTVRNESFNMVFSEIN